MPDDSYLDREMFERQAAVDAAAKALFEAELAYQAARGRWKSRKTITALADAVLLARREYAAAWQAREKAGAL